MSDSVGYRTSGYMFQARLRHTGNFYATADYADCLSQVALSQSSLP
jgi:hypothetical protein